jgi:hypothetical protein
VTAISTQRMTGLQYKLRTLRAKVGADQIIKKGANCGFLGGYLYAWDAIEGLAHPCIAILTTLQTEVDNTGGADGDVTADVDFLVEKMLYPFANDTVAPLTQAHIGGTAYGLDDQTVTADGTGGSAVGTPWIISTGGGTSLRAGVYVEIDPGSLAALAAEAAAAAAAAVPSSAVQAGTDTLASGTKLVAATITASSRIIITMKDPGAGAITGFADFDVPVASRVVGAPGSFTVNAIDDAKATIATAACTFDWLVINL